MPCTAGRNVRAEPKGKKGDCEVFKRQSEVLVQLTDLFVPPVFTPPGKKACERAIVKGSSLAVRMETSMETDAVEAPRVPRRLPLPPLCAS